MRNIIFILLLATLSMIACKKESIETEVKTNPGIISAISPYCSGNTWQYDNLFYSRYYQAGPLVYNNKAYAFNHKTDKVYIYNGTSWDSISSPIPFTSDPNFVFAIGNKGYLGLHHHHESPMPVEDFFWEYDFTANTWIKRADYPGPSIGGAATFSISNKGYVAGGLKFGFPFTSIRDTWEYNQATNFWVKKTDLPFVGINNGAGFSIGNKGYVANGEFRSATGTNVLFSRLVEYDQLTNSWNVKAIFPGAARQNSIAFVISGAAYVGGGEGSMRYKDFYKYSPETNSWTRIADATPVSTSTERFLSGFSINSRGYAVYYNTTYDWLPFYTAKYTPRTCIF